MPGPDGDHYAFKVRFIDIDRPTRLVYDYGVDADVYKRQVEQNAHVALQTADYAYVMENGRVVLDGPAAGLAQNADIKEFYLGLTAVGERKSYRDVKHYKRRKRWLG